MNLFRSRLPRPSLRAKAGPHPRKRIANFFRYYAGNAHVLCTYTGEDRKSKSTIPNPKSKIENQKFSMHSRSIHTEFLRLRVQGLSLAAIGRRLGITKPTLIK